MLPQGLEVCDDTDPCTRNLLPIADGACGGFPSRGSPEYLASAAKGCSFMGHSCCLEELVVASAAKGCSHHM
jgi:hypothetical protein